MKTDIEIAQSIELKPIVDVVEKLGISYDDLELYGKYKAKLSFDKIRAVESNSVGKLILVTAINQHLQVKESRRLPLVLRMP
ncbi:formate--tetrahydrofolate ligase [Streptococcus pneumoniae 801]|nr:formate--tetrahydrofolate ligase [Streptococcus pneumoniae 801]